MIMNNVLVDFLYDFGVILTYELHDAGDVDYEKAVKSYCETEGIEKTTYQKVLEDYCKYYIKNNKGWFPDKEEVAEWYYNYKKVKV